ncbi:MAG: membrane protein insertion efficiency factor YidD [Planctomycetota bacterium]
MSRGAAEPGRLGWPARLASVALIGCVKLYQMTLSPIVGGQCRFRPTCSQYAIEAIREHGPIRGVRLAASRIARCQPLAKGGYDPVPVRDASARRSQEHEGDDASGPTLGPCPPDPPRAND